MRKLLVGLIAAALTYPAQAALPIGAKAPDFTTTGAIAGKPFKLHLAEQLRHGPVVLYFFPKAFTSGCTAEAHAFSESIGDFKKAGARVIGMSSAWSLRGARPRRRHRLSASPESPSRRGRRCGIL